MAQRAQSSTSFTSYAWKYDVFLSFRGEDTRTSFTGNLYKALRDKGVYTFMDDMELRRGEKITPTLFNAIQESRIAIVVFSKNYAQSTFCLEELVQILECIKQRGRLVWPIFYDVDPSDVRHLRKSFGKALAKHEVRFNNNKERIQKWKVALHEASNLSGSHFKKGREYEYEFISRITEDVSKRISRIPLYIANYPVGLESRVQKINSLLDVGSNDEVIMAGIYGFGGIGKTTIARAVYNVIADQFEGVCYLADIRDKAFKYGLAQLQETLLSDIVGEKDIKLHDVNKGISILKHRFHLRKVLLVLDDVDKLRQLQTLAGGCDWFGSGSRIIITTRDRHLLAIHGIERKYEAELIQEEEALKLLKWNAFKSDVVDPSYEDVAKRMVSYCNGLPLALEIIGSNLFGKSLEEWNSALDTYKQIPNKDVQEILRVSFDGLEENQKEIFLDIACFFRGCCLRDLENILQIGRCLKPAYGISVLISKSLIRVEKDCVTMHDLIEDMGREIVRQQSPLKPGKRSRLWFYEDILHVLEENKGTDEIEVIMIHLPKDKEVQWNGKAFKKMKNLKILIIKNAIFPRGPKHLPNSLRVLDWPGYPASSLPFDFRPDKLAILNLSRSCLTLNEPLQKFKSLSEINLSNCEYLEHVPDVSGVPSLTKLNLKGCKNLIEVHNSVGFLNKLRCLVASQCHKLKIFPSVIKSTFLEDLVLSECSSLHYFPEVSGIMGNIRHVSLFPDHSIPIRVGLDHNLQCSTFMLPKISKLIETFGHLSKDKGEDHERVGSTIVSSNVTNFSCRCCSLPDESLSTWLHSFPNLEELDLAYTDLKDEHLPKGLPWSPILKSLDLRATYITILPECIKECHFLEQLLLDDCESLQEIRGIPPNIKILFARNCISLTEQSTSILLSQQLHETSCRHFFVPGERIPQWFDHCNRGQSLSFWFRKKFPIIVLCVVSTALHNDLFHLFINGIIVSSFYLYEFSSTEVPHISLFNLQIKSNICGAHRNIYAEDAWNEAYILPEETDSVNTDLIGVHLYEQDDSRDDVIFAIPIKCPKSTFDYFCESNLKNSYQTPDTKLFWFPGLQHKVGYNPGHSIYLCSSLSLSLPLAIRSMSAHAEIKSLMWKICLKQLPTCDYLFGCKGINSPLCPICETKTETIEHAFLFCPWTQPIWYGSDFQWSIDESWVHTFQDWLYQKLVEIHRVHPNYNTAFALVGNICWAIWEGRNQCFFRCQPVDPWATLIRAKTMNREYSDLSVNQQSQRRRLRCFMPISGTSPQARGLETEKSKDVCKTLRIHKSSRAGLA